MEAVKQHSFNPFTSNEINKIDINTDSKQKRQLKFDVGYFGQLCKKFKEKKDIKIKSLRGEDREEFNVIISYIQVLHGTPYYNHLYEKINKYFGNFKDITPGTIGGYFRGCLDNTVITNNNKDDNNTNVIKPKNEEGWSFCDKAVFLANYTDGHYKFETLKDPEEDNDICYIFVNALSLHDFKGFSSEEIEELNDLGCDKIILVGYDDNGLKYKELYDKPIDIYDVKYRHKHNNNPSNNLVGLALLLIIIFLLLLVLFFGWRWYK